LPTETAALIISDDNLTSLSLQKAYKFMLQPQEACFFNITSTVKKDKAKATF
jgi:hypothetical protein